jgi:hypothetical protein
MNSKDSQVIFVVLLVLFILMIAISYRIERIEMALVERSQNGQISNSSFNVLVTSIINIEKVEGNGNAFGNNNKIENTNS